MSNVALVPCLAAVFVMVLHGESRPTITVESPLPWLQITPPVDPLYTSKVNEAIGRATTANIGAVLPYSVVVTNKGSVQLAGIAIRFTIKTGSRAVTRDFFYQSFGQPSHPVIIPGQSRVFTPLKTANALAAGASRAVGAGGTAGTLSSQGELSTLRELALSDEIHVSVDLAVATDGRYSGVDNAQTVRQLNYQVQAYRAMRDECMSRMNRGDSDGAIIEWLELLAAQKVFVDRQTHSHRYASSQKQNAAAWLAYLKAGKRSELASYLSGAPAETNYQSILSLRGGLQ